MNLVPGKVEKENDKRKIAKSEENCNNLFEEITEYADYQIPYVILINCS